MKKTGLFKATIIGLLCSLCFSACGLTPRETLSIVSIEKTATDGLVDTYTIYYSDGSEYSFEVTNGADGEKGDKGDTGATGEKGEKGDTGDDGEDITVQALYEAYVAEYGEISYAEFLSLYMTLQTDNFTAINRVLQSAVKIYSEFVEPNEDTAEPEPAVYTGSGVVYKIDDDYAYFLTTITSCIAIKRWIRVFLLKCIYTYTVVRVSRRKIRTVQLFTTITPCRASISAEQFPRTWLWCVRKRQR